MASLVVLGVCSLFAFSTAAEPQCSSSCEEILVEMARKAEITLEKIEERLEKVLSSEDFAGSNQSFINQLVEKIDKLESKFTEAMAEQEREIERLKALVFKEPIIFLAELTQSKFERTRFRVFFDHVKINLGNAYNALQGMFVAPVNGAYQFSVNTCSFNGGSAVLDFMINMQTHGRVLSGDTSWSDCSSKQFLVRLTRGDAITVEHNEGDSLYSNPSYGRPSFSGFLIKADI